MLTDEALGRLGAGALIVLSDWVVFWALYVYHDLIGAVNETVGDAAVLRLYGEGIRHF